MAERQAHPPPVKCSATAKRTGEPCGRWAIPGLTTCRLHGGLGGRGRTRADAEDVAGAQLTLATALAARPGRPVWETILDTIRTVDIIAQSVRDDLVQGRTQPDDIQHLDRVVSYARLAHSMAASAVATKALDLATQSAEAWAEIVATRLSWLFTDVLGMPVGGRISQAVHVALDGLDLSGDPAPPPSPDGPTLLDLVGRAVATELAPRLGMPADLLVAWFAAVVGAMNAGRPAPELPVRAVAELPPAPERPADPLAALDREPELEPATESDPELVLVGELIDPHPEQQQPEPEPTVPRMIWDPVRRIMRPNPDYRPPARNGPERITTALGSGPGSRRDLGPRGTSLLPGGGYDR